MAQLVLSPRARRVLVCDAAHPVARAVSVRLADLGHTVLAATCAPAEDAPELDHLPRETARSGVIETFHGPLDASAAHGEALFERLDALVLTAETWAFGPTFTDASRFAALPRRPLVAESLDVVRAFAGLPRAPATRRRVLFVSTLPTIPFTGVGPAQQRAFDALARALRYELRLLGVDVTMVSADLVATAPLAPTHPERLQAALGDLPSDSPYHGLAAPLERAVLALSRQAPPIDRVAEAVVKCLLRKRPKNAVRVRGRGGRLAVPIALRALDRETRRLAKLA
jgi:hypothetical protein